MRSAKYPPEGARGAAFGVAHDNYIPAPVTEVNAYATPTWIVYVYTAGTSAEKALVRLFATADPGQGVAR